MDLTVLKVYIPKRRASEHRRQKAERTDRHICNYHGDSRPPIVADRTIRQKKKKKISSNINDLSNAINQLDMVDIYHSTKELQNTHSS